MPSCAHSRPFHGSLINWLWLCLSGPSMNAGGAPSDAPAQSSLADVGGLLPCATEDGQLRELQILPHPAPSPHIEAVVYPPPHYTPVRVDLHSRHTQQHDATVPESPFLYSRQAATQSPEFSPLPVPPPRRSLPAERGPLAAHSCCRYRKRRPHDVGCWCARGNGQRKRRPPRISSPPSSSPQ
jgi:hypothetical protein